jgi:hypothetical protein
LSEIDSIQQNVDYLMIFVVLMVEDSEKKGQSFYLDNGCNPFV